MVEARSMADQVIHAKWLVPVVPSGLVLADHAVVVKARKIVDILPAAQWTGLYQAAEVIHLDHHMLIPGLINSHGHSAMALLRGVADDLPLEEWLQQHIWPLESTHVGEDFVQHGAELAIAEMLLSGTTCFADMYFFPDVVGRVAGAVGIRVQLASPILDFPTAWAQNADEYIAKATALHDSFRTSELVSTAFGPHAPYTVADAPLKKVATLAEELDIPVHMHVHETAREVTEAVKASGRRPLQRLEELGLLGPRLLCIHATQLLDQEIAMLARYGAHVVHCPESNLKLASGFCPVDRLLAAGVNVALGTDGCASNNDLDLIGELRTASLLAKGLTGNPTTLNGPDSLALATINGARALGLDDRIGSIERGKYADLVALRLDQPHAMPLFNPVSHLVYSARAGDVSHVWVGGRLLVKAGRLTSIDQEALSASVAFWHDRIGK